MFAVIHLPQFSLQAALRHKPELWTKPVALVDPVLTTPRVCDITEAARRIGVTAGLTPTQALARCRREIIIRHRSPGQESAATDTALQCAYAFSPNIENTAPGTVTLDLRGLAEFTGCTLPARRDGERPEDAEPCPTFQRWAERLRADLASLNLRARIGIGPTPNVARHAAWWPVTDPRPDEDSRHDRPALQEPSFRPRPPSRPRLDGLASRTRTTTSTRTNGFMVSVHAQKRKEALHEPTHPLTPSLSPTGGEGVRLVRRSLGEGGRTGEGALDPGPPQQNGNSAHDRNNIRVILDAAAFVASLPVVALEPSSDVALILRKWGIGTVGELLALGQDALVERLGLEALALFAAASTTALRPLHLVRPAERYEESFDFEQEIETIEPLLFILRRFVDGLSQRLELAGLVVELLALKLRLESGDVLERRLRVPQPTRKADVLFRMLHTHLESLRTDSPIVSVVLKAHPTQPEQKQFSLFEAALRDPHQFQETLARLSALVGPDRVGTPVRANSHRPDAFRLVPPDFENAPGDIGRRTAEILRATPLRRFRPAMKAKVEVTIVAPQASSPADDDAAIRQIEQRRPTQAIHPQEVAAMLEPLLGRTVAGAVPRPDYIVKFPGPEPESRAGGVPPASGPDDLNEGLGRRDACPAWGGWPHPVALQCHVTKGQLTVAVGPWRTSGNWWDANAWQREEWDAQTRDGKVLRLVRRPDGWFVEGVLD